MIDRESENFINARAQAKALPENPGCYMMKDTSGTVIYVGKAKNLHRRVNQYFLPDRDLKTQALVAKIHKIDHIITGNEYEALVLENNLIKKYNPHYNILLKDGKSYPVIRITNEDYPKIFSTRRIINDGSKYYGPFPDAGRMAMFLDLIDRLFSFRKCGIPLVKRDRPCLYYYIGRCSGPCCGKVTIEDYRKNVDKVADLLEGRSEALKKKLTSEMNEASKALMFELAGRKRDLIRSIDAVTAEQEVQDFASESRDYAAIEMRSPLCTISLMQIRDGKLLGKALYRAQTLGSEAETLLAFLVQYYSDGKQLPHELYVSQEIDYQLIQDFFRCELHSTISVELPTTGKHFRILRMAKENARRDIEQVARTMDNTAGLAELQNVIGLPGPPALIEGFDIAQLSGKYTVASLISFKDGNPDPKNYRRFNMKTLNGAIDDYASMAEAVRRRYTRVVKEDLPRPDLIMVDGGKGQVNVSRDVLDEVGLADVPVVGLAKERETIVFDDDRPDLNLPLSSEGLRILIAVRDECHRFATGANQAMRSRDVSFKILESVPGIGPVTSARIMQVYGSMDALLEDKPEDISKKAKIGIETAKRLVKKLDITQ
ncbi:MAG: excinuclease ABC subunit UvrC [Sphaerochaetaceae bacterium]|nr:excinuclease ABC subunit UvrC [Sphaerochaetaceae bacterium]MDD3163759.1 excinuclease ABC subunit UvrC [Sphaerochaetaceae bacterium]MDD4007201.1 excinuclease ABC subunit UvrC [Sphaerochaetaceae bacterium]MDD4397349.1 excinuclease ABC subunit UvrC [Sphaerochaetaceae bacterium]